MNRLLIITSALLLTVSLSAQTFNVSNTPELRTALTTSATNGEDDTIILADGTYKTTDDGKGTFIYFSNEANNLTLIGSSSQNVILSGDNTHQILNHNSTENAPMKVEKLSFIDGNNSSTDYSEKNGGGIYTDYSIDVVDCNFTNNSTKYKGGGFSSLEATVRNSSFDNNSAYDGGGFYSLNVTVENSSFNNNLIYNRGGGFYSKYSIVKETLFFNNTSEYEGAGFYSRNEVLLLNSKFINNNALRGSGFAFYNGETKVINSIFINNTGSVLNCGDNGYVELYNLLIAFNSKGISIDYGKNHKVYNSIFIKNNELDIVGASSIIDLKNNYIDLSNVSVSNFASNNIFNGANLGFTDVENGDYTPTSSSDLIDVGIDGITLSDTDLAGNQRVSGSSIDIGPYEFSSTKPTISDIFYSGEAKAYSTLTFTTTATPSGTRTVATTEYDFNGDGSYVSTNTNSFPQGTYTIKVKVTDSEGEYSISSKEITIAPLPFEEMSLEQKLASLTTDQSKLESILADINGGETVSTALSDTDISNLPTGWNLTGTIATITDMSIFDTVNIVWVYSNANSSWSAYSPNSTTASAINSANINRITSIPANSGIWVLK